MNGIRLKHVTSETTLKIWKWEGYKQTYCRIQTKMAEGKISQTEGVVFIQLTIYFDNNIITWQSSIPLGYNKKKVINRQ